MKKIEILDVLQDFLSAFRVPQMRFDRNSGCYETIDLHFREQLYKNYDYKSLYLQMTAAVTPARPVDFCDDFGLHYIIFSEIQTEPAVYCIVGPFLYELPSMLETPHVFNLFLSEKNIPVSYSEHIQFFYKRITVIHDVLAWKQMMRRILSRYLDCDIAFHEVTANSSEYDIGKTALIANPLLSYSSLQARYETENKMLEAITKGDIKEALYYHNLFRGFTLEIRGPNELRSTKNYLIAANTAFRKATEAAFVHPLYVDRLSGQLAVEIENAVTPVQLNHLNTAMIRKYCLLVKTYSRVQYSPLVRDCLNYIDFHYQEILSLQLLAEKFMISKNYLSTLFHKEVGMTLTDYINSIRVRHAILLLNTTDLAMPAIAAQCGFSDANYFTRTFKKTQGMAPHKYRQSLLG